MRWSVTSPSASTTCAGVACRRRKHVEGLFGSVALTLAILGLHGVTSYSVARRRNELGVRIALGAARVIRLVLSEVGVIVLLGLVIGAAAARLATTQVSSLLYGSTRSRRSANNRPLDSGIRRL